MLRIDLMATYIMKCKTCGKHYKLEKERGKETVPMCKHRLSCNKFTDFFDAWDIEKEILGRRSITICTFEMLPIKKFED